mmetsp:Transcript_101798/g.160553  ORF Transcript_101798/g.160553 Transcript_101798/m.160553 type:complete len:218 (-) Transcript_101798:35-688(-)
MTACLCWAVCSPASGSTSLVNSSASWQSRSNFSSKRAMRDFKSTISSLPWLTSLSNINARFSADSTAPCATRVRHFSALRAASNVSICRTCLLASLSRTTQAACLAASFFRRSAQWQQASSASLCILSPSATLETKELFACGLSSIESIFPSRAKGDLQCDVVHGDMSFIADGLKVCELHISDKPLSAPAAFTTEQFSASAVIIGSVETKLDLRSGW